MSNPYEQEYPEGVFDKFTLEFRLDKYRAFAVADKLMHSKLDKGYYKTQKCGDELEFN